MPPLTLLLGLSGPSCSGKTTLARLLRDALSPHAFILHEDDFYKPDAEIPVKTVADGRELQDWDCLESLNVEDLQSMLEYIKREGRVKEEFESKEDQNDVGEVAVDSNALDGWKQKFGALFSSTGMTTKIGIIDGFLLYSEDMEAVRECFDVRLLLRVDYKTVKTRRKSRKGYVTLEGFWEDPEGYVDLIVWPNYVKDHKFLFRSGDVDGELDEALCERLKINAMPRRASCDMTECFQWAANSIYKSLEGGFKD